MVRLENSQVDTGNIQLSSFKGVRQSPQTGES